MAFRVDMSPLVRASENRANLLTGLGGMLRDQRLQRGEQQQQDQALQAQEAKKNRDIATADLIEKIHLLPEDRQEAIFEQAITDDRYDIDEDDRPYFMDKNARRALVSQVKGKDYADNFFGADSGDNQLPAEAAAFNDLIKDMTPEQQKTAKLIKAGLKGRAITNAEMTAIQDGTIDSYGQWKTEQKQKEKFAEATGANRAKIIDQGFDKINKADVALRNIDKAVAALDKGAGVGAVEKLWPSITAASVELDNIRGQMALDVVGAVTFGALSEGELNLAKDVALPTGLDTNQLKDYLARKKAAQQKLRAYYYDQIQHLDQGGTVASFLRSKEREQQPTTGTQEVNQDEQALQWARANPNDPRAAAILQKLGAQ